MLVASSTAMTRQARHPGDARHRNEVSARKRQLERVHAGAGHELGTVGNADHAVVLGDQLLVVDALLAELVTERRVRDPVQFEDVAFVDLDDLVRHEIGLARGGGPTLLE